MFLILFILIPSTCSKSTILALPNFIVVFLAVDSWKHTHQITIKPGFVVISMFLHSFCTQEVLIICFFLQQQNCLVLEPWGKKDIRYQLHHLISSRMQKCRKSARDIAYYGNKAKFEVFVKPQRSHCAYRLCINATKQISFYTPAPITNLTLSLAHCEEFFLLLYDERFLKCHSTYVWESLSSSSQGVVALPNGNWAAHVYVSNKWILLGIFGTEKEASIAYENTTLNIWMESCKLYLQGINNGEHEPLTLQQASLDSTHSSSSVNIPQVNGEQDCIRTQLFGKVLTRSDVGKADKLVIPKIFAGCFPSIPDGDESSVEERPVNDVELGFYDQSMTLWKFRYCYWRKSKTYSLSRGWRKFVEEKNLSSTDEVIFFKCERVEETSIVDTHYMIDVEYANKVQVEEVGGNMGEAVVSSRSEGVPNIAGEIADVRHVTEIQADNDLEGAGAGSGKAPEKSLMLFGVKIIV
ncbi:hypothetical protein POM88_005743 [Heracleum sosnowskyi]|uniref:TF-B3 domain-containing protein n=1 Tax=Heracleum sosnowskyi TaxID=360622 RepID=A0AAD8MZD5_9APIA|nr:hypothetical protein POM88_005743 [Heracleum sosnowskyi]